MKTNQHPQLRELELAIYKFCAGFAKTPAKGYMLILFGNNGTGKTHCAKAVMKWLSHVARALPLVVADEGHCKQVDSMFIHWPAFLDSLKSGQWELADDAVAATLLILDEVGGGHDPSRMGLDKLCRILSQREKKWTLVTTNLMPDSWEEAFDRRVASRLFRCSVQVDLSAVPDYSTV